MAINKWHIQYLNMYCILGLPNIFDVFAITNIK